MLNMWNINNQRFTFDQLNIMSNMMKIKINSTIETKAFDLVRNKPNMKDIFIRDIAKVFGLRYEAAKRMLKIKVTWEEASHELL